MSNDYYTYGNTLIAGDEARAEDVAGELQGIQSGLDLLPKPRPAGDGFLEAFKVPDATDPEHVANIGQLQTIETNVTNARDTTIAARDTTTAARDTTTAARDTTLTYRNEAEGFKDTAETAAAAAQSAAGLPSLTGNSGNSLLVNGAEDGVLWGAPDVSATHYTKAESDNRYYTQAQVDSLLGDDFNWTFDAVGSVAAGSLGAEVIASPGSTYSGSSITADWSGPSSTTLSGTWRALGHVCAYTGGPTLVEAALFVRIA